MLNKLSEFYKAYSDWIDAGAQMVNRSVVIAVFVFP